MVALTAEGSGRQRLACLTIDMEPDLRCPERRIRLLDDDRRLTTFSELLHAEGVPLTSFTVMSHAARYIDRLNDLARRIDVEYAVHSFTHDTANPASDDEVRRAADEFGRLWNRAPLGYRTPNCLIDERGIDALIRAGYAYDSSIVPSVRFDKYSYNNLHYGRDPFQFVGRNGTLMELPIATLAALRLPLVFSYVKLFGLLTYEVCTRTFPLPDVVVTYFHPYDLYVGEIAGFIPGWKRYAHLRSSGNAMELLRRLIRFLKGRGYAFVRMNDVAERMRTSDLPHRALEVAA